MTGATKILLVLLAGLASTVALGDPQPDSEQEGGTPGPEPLASIGVVGGGGFSRALGWQPTLGFALSAKNLSLENNEPGVLESAALGYLYPASGATTAGSLYFYLGMGLLPGHALGIGPMIGVSEQNISDLIKPQLTAGGRISLELPPMAGLSVVPSIAVVSNGLPVAMPVALLTLEIRYSFSAAFMSLAR